MKQEETVRTVSAKGQEALLVVRTTPWDLEEDIGAFLRYYNARRYH